jgi:hypothetical protein
VFERGTTHAEVDERKRSRAPSDSASFGMHRAGVLGGRKTGTLTSKGESLSWRWVPRRSVAFRGVGTRFGAR